MSQRAQMSIPSASMVVCMRCTSSRLRSAWHALPWRSRAGHTPACQDPCWCNILVPTSIK